MPGQDEPKTNTEENPDAAAKDAAKEFAHNAGDALKALDQKHKVYLAALGVTLLCSLLFGAFKVTLKGGGEMGAFVSSMMSDQTSPALIGLSGGNAALGGKLAFLGALAGIGILIWSATGKRKDSWIPLALAGSAGIALLGIMITRSGIGGGSSNEIVKMSVDGTLLGWWLPFAGAVTATVVSVQRILKAKPAAS